MAASATPCLPPGIESCSPSNTIPRSPSRLCAAKSVAATVHYQVIAALLVVMAPLLVCALDPATPLRPLAIGTAPIGLGVAAGLMIGKRRRPDSALTQKFASNTARNDLDSIG